MFKKTKKFISILLAAIMVLGLLPAIELTGLLPSALAAEPGPNPGSGPAEVVFQINGEPYEGTLQRAIDYAPEGATIALRNLKNNSYYYPDGLHINGKSVVIDNDKYPIYIGDPNYANVNYGILAENKGSISFTGKAVVNVMADTGLYARSGGKISITAL